MSPPPPLPDRALHAQVDVKACGSVHKGMTHKFYHGKTGIVYNVTKRAVGVEMNKPIRTRIIKKRVNVRVEHVHPSKCRLDFIARVKANETIKREYKKRGEKVPLELVKRFPGTPKPSHVVKAVNAANQAPTLIAPLAFDELI